MSMIHSTYTCPIKFYFIGYYKKKTIKRTKSNQQNDWYVCNIQCRYYKLGLRCARLREEERREKNAINSGHYVLPGTPKGSASN